MKLILLLLQFFLLISTLKFSMANTTKKTNIVMIFSPSSMINNAPKVGIITYHPERKVLLPKIQCVNWNRLEHLVDFSVIKYEENVYILGGYDMRKKRYKRQILRYDICTGKIYVCEKMATARSCFTAFVFDGKIYCAGGYSLNKTILQDVECYEPLIDTCFPDELLPKPCAGYACASTEQTAFLIGGIVLDALGKQVPSNHFWMLTKQKTPGEDEIKCIWVELAFAQFPTSFGIVGHTCVMHDNGSRLYVIGGKIATNPNVKNEDPNMIEHHVSDCGIHYFNMEMFFKLLHTSKNITKKAVASKVKEKQLPCVWKRILVPECRRSHAGVYSFGHKLFVIGGNKHYIDRLHAPHDIITQSAASSNETDTTTPDIDNSSVISDLSTVDDVGYYSTRHRKWMSLFSLSEINYDFRHVICVPIEPVMTSKLCDFSRLDWMLQWAIW